MASLAAGGTLLALAPTARAAIPAGYLGTPFNPATVGGAGIIPASVTAGPFKLPGRLDFVNYDMGGDGTAFHTDAHYTTKEGDGYRTDRPTATMCLTATSKPDIFYDTGDATKDGMPYPAAGMEDFYVGSVHPNDWFDYTVDVQTAGMYTLDGVFATGNGPPGGEGGDGQMELVISVNGAMQADWKTVFPDFTNKANFHNWRPYPAFAKLSLEQGISVIKFQAPFKHLNLDYVVFKLDGAGGGGSGGAGGTAAGGSAGASGAAGASGGAGGTTSAGTDAGGSGGTPVVTGESGTGTTTTGGGGTSGSPSGAGTTSLPTAGTASAAGSAPIATADSGSSGGCGCSLGKQQRSSTFFGLGALLGLSLVWNARRRSARR